VGNLTRTHTCRCILDSDNYDGESGRCFAIELTFGVAAIFTFARPRQFA